MPLTISQPIVFSILFPAIGACLLITTVYMILLYMKNSRKLKDASISMSREPHPYAWRTRI
jgi:hypothetical protein